MIAKIIDIGLILPIILFLNGAVIFILVYLWKKVLKEEDE